MHEVIDLTSDTATRPTEAMRRAIGQAEVGDAAFAKDPTVNLLEERVARLLEKEAALYVVSGTMANALAIRLCCEAGDEVIAESNCHPVYYEAGGSGAFSGVIFKTVPGERGIIEPEQVAAAIYDYAYYRPVQRAVLIENTHNRGGGTVYPLETIRAIAEVARPRGLRLHMDGARLWNASVATGVSMADYARPFDTVSVCFSKGMGAPVGSVLAGSRKDIERAWHYRHMLGGTWRQAGLLAAGALHALDHHFDRLAEDHENAARLGRGLQERCGLTVVNRVETNMVYFEHPCASALVDSLKGRKILMNEIRPGVVRCVTHLGVDAEDMDRVIETVAENA